MTYVARPAGAPLSSIAYRRQSVRSFGLPLLLILFAGAALISGFTILRDIDPFDEGLVVQAARRVAEGQVPYRDFLWAYGPALPYLLAGLIKLFGVSLLHWRILWVLANAGVSVVSCALVRAHSSRTLAFLAWLAVACEMAEPRTANPFPFALLALLVALWLTSTGEPTGRRVFAAGALTAVAAAFRIDFAIYGAVALVVVLAVRVGARPAVRYLVGAVALTALLYLPFAIDDGPASLYHALIGTSLHTGAYWSLPFPLHYRAPPGAGLSKTLKHGLDFYVPLLVVIGLLVSVAGALVQWRRQRYVLPVLLGLLVFGAGALAYLLSRTDQFHAQPLFVVVTMALAVLAIGVPRALGALCMVLLALLLAHAAGNRLSALFKPPRESTIHVAAAGGAQAPPAEARAIERMVRIVDGQVPLHGFIYVLPRRSDLVRFNNPLIYVLTERDNPAPQDFGLLTGARAQARIVSELERARPRIIVRWTDPISSQREPNLRGRSSGVDTLDTWVALHYRLIARLYHYDVLRAVG